MGVPVTVPLRDCSRIGIRVTLGLEAAAGYWGMSTFDYNGFPIFIYESDDGAVHRYSNFISFAEIPRRLNDGHRINISNVYGDGIFVTDKEQTVCDMIICDCGLFHLLETLDDFLVCESSESIAVLEELVKKYGVYERYLELKKMTEEEYD